MLTTMDPTICPLAHVLHEKTKQKDIRREDADEHL